jgi:hypothetical protein
MGTEEKTLEDRLEELLEQETFAPPDEFRQQANISDDSIYDEADKDYEGFWEQQAEARPAERQVVRQRQAERRVQLRRPSRGGRQRRPRRVPLAR